MYFAYGFPKVYGLGSVSNYQGSRVIYLACCAKTGLFVLATSNAVQVWSSGQHRVKLGELVRNVDDIEQHGLGNRACWNPAQRVLAVATDASKIIFIGLNPTGHPACRVPGFAHLQKVSVYIQNTRDVSSPVCDFWPQAGSLVAVHTNYSLSKYSWSANLRSTSSLLTQILDDRSSIERFIAHEDIAVILLH